jgi:hypothetical protein
VPALEDLSTAELHDLAVAKAEKHLDVRFFWRLIESIPAAEAAAGNLPKADADVMSLRMWLGELGEIRDGALAESLRPFYVDYLEPTSDER